MEAIILAGGLGTRLSQVVQDVPKPMAPVNGKPFLEYIFELLYENDFKKVILSVGYKKEIIKDYFKNRYKDIEIEYSEEKELLGTGGAIKKALNLCSTSDVFIMNGDTIFEIDYSSMYDFHKKNNSKLTIAIKKLRDFDRYGTVVLENNRIINFLEKKYTKEGFINGGIYLVNRSLLEKEEKIKFSFEKEILENKNNNLIKYGYESSKYFIDIGIPEDYYNFKKRNQYEK